MRHATAESEKGDGMSISQVSLDVGFASGGQYHLGACWEID